MYYQVISLILLLVLFGVIIYYEHKKNDRKSYEFWRSEVRSNLNSIVYTFRSDCENITQDVFNKYSSFMSSQKDSNHIVYEYQINWHLDFISEHNKKITQLTNSYKKEVDEKMKERMGRYSFKTVPSDLRSEYETDISKIADIYISFNTLMRSSIREKRE